MSTRRITPDLIETLEPEEVFVFGSNAAGYHAGGAARIAYERFGAVWGDGHGHRGQSYAINTMGGLEELAEQAAIFIAYAKGHPSLTFLLTPVGCGIAGFTPQEVAPLFAGAPANVTMPMSFMAEADA
ncbi:A1S_2505 family phage non-structural protein [Microbacterium enclense]|uniref:A1S_2505 family phage non-structural protein n=1 Tax=Microbacterium enclense TaxID=993073 RepID=UPI003F7E76F3